MKVIVILVSDIFKSNLPSLICDKKCS